jgi:hypothetical protein
VNANYSVHAAQGVTASPAVKPRLEVSFQNGLLSVSSHKANLSEILFAIHQRTGAEIAIPAGAEQEQVAADFGPGPASEVLAHLLNGSKFNFMILSSATNPQALDRVILSPRAEAAMFAASSQTEPALDEDAQASQAMPVRSLPIPSIDDPNAPPDPKPSDGNVPD